MDTQPTQQVTERTSQQTASKREGGFGLISFVFAALFSMPIVVFCLDLEQRTAGDFDGIGILFLGVYTVVGLPLLWAVCFTVFHLVAWVASLFDGTRQTHTDSNHRGSP
jgi:hypothetical protein